MHDRKHAGPFEIRVVREHRLHWPLVYTPTLEELDRALRSVEAAITTLQRQRASILPRFRRALEAVTDEQAAAVVPRFERYRVLCEGEDAGNRIVAAGSDDGGSSAA
jgi:ABC-type hemin transport system substrate-binding protein